MRPTKKKGVWVQGLGLWGLLLGFPCCPVAGLRFWVRGSGVKDKVGFDYPAREFRYGPCCSRVGLGVSDE